MRAWTPGKGVLLKLVQRRETPGYLYTLGAVPAGEVAYSCGVWIREHPGKHGITSITNNGGTCGYTDTRKSHPGRAAISDGEWTPYVSLVHDNRTDKPQTAGRSSLNRPLNYDLW
ncbi:hypothetical protein Bbelb_172980 [Branchiostoma belcheri]|nr:hypothetical protein Bbelb_172980 [Branchiostoma belcheri]